MREPVRVQRQAVRGHQRQTPPGAVFVGNGSKWMQRYRTWDYGRDQAVALYRQWLLRMLAQGKADLEPLRGKNLACDCSRSVPCHADVLLEFANRTQ